MESEESGIRSKDTNHQQPPSGEGAALRGRGLQSGYGIRVVTGDAEMYFRKPVVLMLGGLLTAAAIGCSAASVLVTDQRSKQSVRQSSSDRMLAIGRMFEEQGQLDRADAMYRGALKKNGRNQEARQLLSDLQTRRRSPQPALVAAVPRPARTMGVSAQMPVPAAPVREVAAKPPVTAAATVPATSPATPVSPAAQPVKTVSRLKNVAATSSGNPATPAGPATPASPVPGSQPVENKAVEKAVPKIGPAATPAPASVAAPESAPQSSVKTISLDEILAAAESPEEHSAVLAEALKSGDGPEARCLAAALLGECSSGDAQVAAALQESGRTTDDVSLLLAVVDSQQQHNLIDSATVTNLIRLLPDCEPSVQVQGMTLMRHCSTLSCREECLGLLTGMLESSHADVRAAAALTLSDFRPLSVETVSRLETLSAGDSSAEVRESAAASLARGVK